VQLGGGHTIMLKNFMFHQLTSLAHIFLRRVEILFLGCEATARRSGVKIGTDCRIYSANFGSEPWLVTIGDRVTVTSGVQFLTHDGSLWLFRDARGRRFRYAPIEVGNNVFIGINATLLPGVKVGDNVIIATGAVVTKSIPSGVVVGGVPARVLGSYKEFEDRALRAAHRESDMVGKRWRDRVNSIVDKTFRPAL
jgi:acetyltransferase-like isoleucine patch superfamily enzyme